jgi:proteasome lid subunit RPN8/RPN11
MINKLYLRENHWNEMLEDILERSTEEACGIVAGIDGTSCAVFPVTNVLHSPNRFLMDPGEQLDVFNLVEERDWQLLAIYHSHLQGPDSPSPIDIAEAYYPELITLIWSKSFNEWICRGFSIREGKATSVPVVRWEPE